MSDAAMTPAQRVMAARRASARSPSKPRETPEWSEEDAPIMAGLAQGILARLQQAGVSQVALAEAANLNPASISEYVRMQSAPTVLSLVKLCRALGVTPNDLLGFPEGGE